MCTWRIKNDCLRLRTNANFTLIFPYAVTEIFKNSDQRKRILKIIIQTLYNLGYEQSANELEAESKITYLTPEIKAIKTALPE